MNANALNSTTQLNANDLKVGGVTAIEAALSNSLEAFISVRGDRRYVVMRAEQYDYLRECELESAWLATQADRTSGRAKSMTADEHIAEMQRRLQTVSAAASTAAVHMAQQPQARYDTKVKNMKSKSTEKLAEKKRTKVA